MVFVTGSVLVDAPAMCKILSVSSDRHLEYTGTVNVSKNGEVCESWASNSEAMYENITIHCSFVSLIIQ